MLSWEFPPSVAGGTAAHVDGLAHAFARSGHDVVVITRRVAGTQSDALIGGIRVLRADVELPWLDDNRVAAVASGNHAMVAAATALGEWQPDVVHAHDWEVAWASNVLAAQHRVPVVTTFHGTDGSFSN